MADPIEGPLDIQDSAAHTLISLQAIRSEESPHVVRCFGRIIIQDIDGNTIIEIGRGGHLSAGGGGFDGQLLLFPGVSTDIRDSHFATINLNGRDGIATFGGNGKNGEIYLSDVDGANRTFLSANNGEIYLNDANGANRVSLSDHHGTIVLKSSEGSERIRLEGETGDATLGGNGRNGDIFLNDVDGANRVFLSAQDGEIRLRQTNGTDRITLSANNGEIVLRGADGTGRIYVNPGDSADIYFGGNHKSGNLRLFPSTASDVIHIPAQATIDMNGENGEIVLRGSDGTERIRLNDQDRADITLGGNGRAGNIRLYSSAPTGIHDYENATIHLNGDSGDILLGNADCAEDFEIVDSVDVEPGTVMVIDTFGRLQPCQQAYDKRVAGVISGAGECKPGIVLNKKESAHPKMPLALVGKVYCKVDAQYGPIEVGDLLTTAPHPGHAMKAGDPLKAFGSVIGKALHPMKEGRGLIPILIALQ